ncbi:MAG: DNA gyrase inhibitor YacG [Verrucomicrobiales bacterium]|nr:DNA gyrase inhibitor YacG [Verrucomicrobiales bacterium]MCP5527142.1 DNA gyrase inhibitor YacG [Verrucomicrobiales bacterium]
MRCPACGRRGAWFGTPFGPFCSKRCRLIDLGRWLGEEHTISEPLRPDHFAGYENLPPGEHLDRPEPE